MSPVLMMMQMMLKELVNESQRQVMSIIISQINLIVCLVNDIADLKKIEEGRFFVHKVNFNPRETLKFVMGIFDHQC